LGAIDLEAYFQRIGYSGPRCATLEVLQSVHRAHVGAIAYEALNPLLGRPVSLATEALEEKLVRSARGGYCFEQNSLLLHVIEALAFHVTPLAARVRWNMPADAPQTPLSHMILLVHLPDGDFLCDVGFGTQNPPVPLRFEPDLEQMTSHGTFRLKRAAQDYTMQTHLPEGWSPMYRFRLDMQSPADYEVYNWYTSAHPQSRFVNNLAVARIVGDKRLVIRNREFGVRQPDGTMDRSEFESPEAVHETLARDFGIAIECEEIARVWPRLPRPD
jgi:N-hydroxyarylamine O-acetyltransferase